MLSPIEGDSMAGAMDEFEDLIGGGESEKTPPAVSIDQTMFNGAVHAPTVFADGLVFATKIGSNIRLQFAEYSPHPANHPDPGLKTRHVVTVVMPPEGFENMMTYLQDVTPKFIFPTEAEDGE